MLLIKYNFFVFSATTYATTFIDPGIIRLTPQCEKHVTSNRVLNFVECVKYCNDNINCLAVRYNGTGCYAYKYITVADDKLTESLFLKDTNQVLSAKDCANQRAVNNLGNYSLRTIIACSL